MVASSKNKDSVMLPEHTRQPIFCRDRHDYVKLYFAILKSCSDSFEEMSALNDTFKALCHDYMALVLQGEIRPYNIKFADKETEKVVRQDFEELMAEVSGQMVEQGVPTKEDGKGRIIFDDDEMRNLVEKRNGK